MWKLEAIDALRQFTEDSLQLRVPDELLILIAAFGQGALQWDLRSCDGCDISVKNHATLTKSSQRWQVCVVDTLFEYGQKGSFSLKIVDNGSSRLNEVAIGVSRECHVANQESLKLQFEWAAVGRWDLWSNWSGIQGPDKYCSYRDYGFFYFWVVGDIITVTIDFSSKTMESTGKGTMVYKLNDKDLGVAFVDVEPPVQPAVSLLTSGCCLEIVEICSEID